MIQLNAVSPYVEPRAELSLAEACPMTPRMLFKPHQHSQMASSSFYRFRSGTLGFEPTVSLGLSRRLLENPLHHARTDAELPADLENTVTADLQFEYACLH
jgi:hypothetical protein